MKKRTKYVTSVVISFLLVLITAVVIFMFSSQTGEESGQTSRSFAGFVLQLLNPEYNDMTVKEQLRYCEEVQLAIRKIAHFTEFFALGFFLELYLDIRKYRLAPIISLIVGVVYAFFDEWHQNFVDSRGPSLRDVFIDSLGVLSGIIIMLIIRTIYKNVKKR